MGRKEYAEKETAEVPEEKESKQTENTFDLSALSETELKASAYDWSVQLEIAREQLNFINQELIKRNKK